MQFVSTRGVAPAFGFREAMLAGLAIDGGLYVPKTLPQFSPADIARFATLSYEALAFEILHPFTHEAFDAATLKRMIAKAYGSFRHAAIAPITQLSQQHFVLELFHGPTLAFKDFALQLLGEMMEELLKCETKPTVVLGATSGDTGSAAIAGLRGKANLNIVILYPRGRTSEVQRRQMTTVADANVHALAVDGTFDDCQDMVKALFADAPFRAQVNLLAVNSINIARVLAQTVYYFYAACALGAPARRVNFCVPTGNFGDIYAGYLARQMGLPMGKLIIASNRNDILSRCLHTGTYAMQGVAPSHSPSMDIEISSNFERLLFDLYGQQPEILAAMMQQFRAEKSLTLSPAALADFRRLFAAHAVNDTETLATMQRVHAQCGYLLDPHTAVGIAAAEACEAACGELPILTLATAHPAKFPDAVREAVALTPPLPAHMENLYALPERINVQEKNLDALKERVRAL